MAQPTEPKVCPGHSHVSFQTQDVQPANYTANTEGREEVRLSGDPCPGDSGQPIRDQNMSSPEQTGADHAWLFFPKG